MIRLFTISIGTYFLFNFLIHVIVDGYMAQNRGFFPPQVKSIYLIITSVTIFFFLKRISSNDFLKNKKIKNGFPKKVYFFPILRSLS